MPALLLVLGLAVVVFMAAAGHQDPKHPALPLNAQPTPPPGSVVVELDRGMPPSVVDQVLAALGRETDPERLEDLATSLGAHYPLSASELHAKAMTLRARSGAASPSPSTPAAVAPATAEAPAPAQATQETEAPEPKPDAPPEEPANEPPVPGELDAATVLQAAMRALVDETDPVVLEGFADSIRDPYPAAAEILADRATELRASPFAGASSTNSSAPPAIPSPSRSLELPS
jgi:hypothetical protein